MRSYVCEIPALWAGRAWGLRAWGLRAWGTSVGVWGVGLGVWNWVMLWGYVVFRIGQHGMKSDEDIEDGCCTRNRSC
jgi:hypothetical protein